MKTLRNLAARGLASMSIKLMAWAVDLAPYSTGMSSKLNKDNP